MVDHPVVITTTMITTINGTAIIKGGA